MTISNFNALGLSLPSNYLPSQTTTTKSALNLSPHILTKFIWAAWTSNCTTEERVHLMTTLPLVNTMFRNYTAACESRRVYIPCPSYVTVFLTKLSNSRRRPNDQTLDALGISIGGGESGYNGAPQLTFDLCFALTVHFDIADVLKYDDDYDPDFWCDEGFGDCMAGRVHAAELKIMEAMRRLLLTITRYDYFPALHEVNFKFINMDTPRILNTLNVFFVPVSLSNQQVNIEIIQTKAGLDHPVKGAQTYSCWSCVYYDVNYVSMRWMDEWKVNFAGAKLKLEGRQEDIRTLSRYLRQCSWSVKTLTLCPTDMNHRHGYLPQWPLDY
ncbi:hypothetical protein AX16_010035 [Volvariella volvacea WC 439]|nr:hypothetical protein AX16_010035 [Volvariella volvacea WC 439]